MRIVGFIFLALLGLGAIIGLSIALDLGGLWYQKETAPFRGQSEAERSIESGQSRIQFYNEFYDLCAGVQSKENQIAVLQANKSMPEQKKDAAITALRMARQELVAQYNKRASQNYTAARFKDAKLPYNLSSEPYNGQQTKCAN